MATAKAASRPDGAGRRGEAEPVGGAVEVLHRLEDAEAVWRALEHDAIMAPYGRYDWVAAYQRALPDGGRGTRIAVQRDADGRPVFLMPFQLERRLGLVVATSIGGKHANYHLPLLAPEAAVGLRPHASALLAAAGRAIGADLLIMPNVPATWNGLPNPFAEGGHPSASNAWALRLEADGPATLARSMSGEARKKMRNKARGLAKVGPVRAFRASSVQEGDLQLDAFYRQKARRFGELGIADPFADPALRGFLHDAATRGLADGDPAVEIHGLTVGEDVIAVLGGAVDRNRFSGMIVSFEAGPLDRFSPGEMLIVEVIDDLCRRGFRVFDLGAGDARYKRSICDEAEALLDLVIPLTVAGRAAALVEAGLLRAKRRIKASPRAMALVRRVRKLKAARAG